MSEAVSEEDLGEDLDSPPAGRGVMFPADLFDRPAYRRMARRWPQALAWWMRLVLVAREALWGGQLLVGGQPLTLEDLQECDPAGIDPEFISTLVRERWIVGDGKALKVARWGDWYRAPSRTKEAQATRKRIQRANLRQMSAGGPQVSEACPHLSANVRKQPILQPIRSDPSSSSDPAAGYSAREPENGALPTEAKAVLDRLRAFNSELENRPPPT